MTTTIPAGGPAAEPTPTDEPPLVPDQQVTDAPVTDAPLADAPATDAADAEAPVADAGAPPGQPTPGRTRRVPRRDRTAVARADALAAVLEPAVRLLPLQDRPQDPRHLRAWLADTVRTSPDGGQELFDAYATPPPPRLTPPAPGQRSGRTVRVWDWYRRHVWNAPGVVFVLATGAALGGYLAFDANPAWRVPVLCGFLVVLPTLLPGFLYLRFITFRIGPLRDEYVYNLHRLGVDAPEHLPEPPRASEAWARWYDAGGTLVRETRNIYRSKFESQYGRWPAGEQDVHKESLGQLLSLYLCLVVLAVGWAGVVWTVPMGDDLPRQADALRFGFLGAYFFLLSLLVRRYFQNDLRPGTYLSGVVRVVTVLVLVVAVDQAWAATVKGSEVARPDAALNVVAFLVGVFPSVGMQFLRRAVGKLTGVFRGGLEPPFPLSQLDGMDIWSEARLLEVGIEDVQHLATANLVDVCLGARIPTQRVVDWVDQSLLLLRTGLPRTDNLRQPTTYAELRGLSVRTATDLLDLVEDLQLDLSPTGTWHASDARTAALMAVAQAGEATGKRGEVRPSCVPLLIRMAMTATTLRHEPNLPLVRSWHETAPEVVEDDDLVGV